MRSNSLSKALNCFRPAVLLAILGPVGLGFLLLLGLWLKELGFFNIDDSRLSILVNHQPRDNTFIYDRDGNIIGELFTDSQKFPVILLKLC